MYQLKTEQLQIIKEPLLTFGHKQEMQDPRDGLFLFGPLDDKRNPSHMRTGVIGTPGGIALYKLWTQKIKAYIPSGNPASFHNKAFPGFQSTFGTNWPDHPIAEIKVSEEDIFKALLIKDRHEAIYKTVSLFENAIRTNVLEEDSVIDVWFIVIPEDVHRLGRPKSIVPTENSIPSEVPMSEQQRRRLLVQSSMFPGDNAAAQVYKYEVNFHNQLKARVLDIGAVIQIIRETSLIPEDFYSQNKPSRKLQDSASIAWNLCTTAYFKSGGRPWKLSNVREGVCYIGLVFKKIDSANIAGGNACCGAQMFLDSGDGLVFKGAAGPWYSNENKEFHLSHERAKELMIKVVESYTRTNGLPPKELFIHGKTHFNDEEWEGFRDAVPMETNLVGVRIRDAFDIKLFTPVSRPVLRGTFYQMNGKHGYLWTRGYVPQLRTYSGREIPNALDVHIHRGRANLAQVMTDIMGLTKVNFNACIFADGYPVTLRFADAVGEILTAAPLSTDLPPLPFRHYI